MTANDNKGKSRNQAKCANGILLLNGEHRKNRMILGIVGCIYLYVYIWFACLPGKLINSIEAMYAELYYYI